MAKYNVVPDKLAELMEVQGMSEDNIKLVDKHFSNEMKKIRDDSRRASNEKQQEKQDQAGSESQPKTKREMARKARII